MGNTARARHLQLLHTSAAQYARACHGPRAHRELRMPGALVPRMVLCALSYIQCHMHAHAHEYSTIASERSHCHMQRFSCAAIRIPGVGCRAPAINPAQCRFGHLAAFPCIYIWHGHGHGRACICIWQCIICIWKSHGAAPGRAMPGFSPRATFSTALGSSPSAQRPSVADAKDGQLQTRTGTHIPEI